LEEIHLREDEDQRERERGRGSEGNHLGVHVVPGLCSMSLCSANLILARESEREGVSGGRAPVSFEDLSLQATDEAHVLLVVLHLTPGRLLMIPVTFD
jgi:precorrin-2 methylase